MRRRRPRCPLALLPAVVGVRRAAPRCGARRYRRGVAPRHAVARAGGRRRQHHRRRRGQDAARAALAAALARARLSPGHRQPRLRTPHDGRASRGGATTTRATSATSRCSSRETGVPVWVGARPRRGGARAARRASRTSTSSSPTTACSTTRSRATSRSRSSTATRGSATAVLLPAGPLREPASRLAIGRCGRARLGAAAPRRRADGRAQFAMTHVPQPWRNVADPARAFDAARCCAIQRRSRSPASRIPSASSTRCAAQGFAGRTHAFPDHHRYSRDDVAFPGARAILMTEKDAVKCRAFADARMWMLPIRARRRPRADRTRRGEDRWIPSCSRCSCARSPRARCLRPRAQELVSRVGAARVSDPRRHSGDARGGGAQAHARGMGSAQGRERRARTRFTVLIPARYASTRLPGKPLADIGGQPMVVRVAERARASGARARRRRHRRCAHRRCASRAHGFDALMTRADHATGTDRLAEAAALLGLAPDEIVVNVQGDEPLLEPALMRRVARLLARTRRCGDGHRVPPDRRRGGGVQPERRQGRARCAQLRAVLQPRDDPLGARRVRRRRARDPRRICRCTATSASTPTA